MTQPALFMRLIIYFFSTTKMTQGIKIVPASEVGITNLNNTIIVNDYMGTVGLRHVKHDAKATVAFPISKLGNQKISYWLPTGEAAI